jgi:hypothetical protein
MPRVQVWREETDCVRYSLKLTDLELDKLMSGKLNYQQTQDLLYEVMDREDWPECDKSIPGDMPGHWFEFNVEDDYEPILLPKPPEEDKHVDVIGALSKFLEDPLIPPSTCFYIRSIVQFLENYKPMKTYEITFTRQLPQSTTVTVAAPTIEQAKNEAWDKVFDFPDDFQWEDHEADNFELTSWEESYDE